MRWCATRPATNPAAGPDHTLAVSSIAAHHVARRSGQSGAPAAQRGRTRLTVTSSGTQSGAEEASETMPRKGARPGTSQPVLPVRRWTARRAGPHADVTMADTQPCYAASSLAAGPSPLRQPERRQLTHDHDHEVEYRQRGRQAPPAPSGKPHAEPHPTATGRPPTPAQRLDTTYRQLGNPRFLQPGLRRLKSPQLCQLS